MFYYKKKLSNVISTMAAGCKVCRTASQNNTCILFIPLICNSTATKPKCGHMDISSFFSLPSEMGAQ